MKADADAKQPGTWPGARDGPPRGEPVRKWPQVTTLALSCAHRLGVPRGRIKAEVVSFGQTN